MELGAELGAAERACGASEEIEHAAIDLAGRVGVGGRGGGDDGEVNIDILASDELEAQRIGSRGSAMLDREQQGVLLSAEVEIGIAPGVKVTAAAERQTGLGAGAAVLAGMVDDEDGDVVLAL
jgi:hypothetical protein